MPRKYTMTKARAEKVLEDYYKTKPARLLNQLEVDALTYLEERTSANTAALNERWQAHYDKHFLWADGLDRREAAMQKKAREHAAKVAERRRLKEEAKAREEAEVAEAPGTYEPEQPTAEVVEAQRDDWGIPDPTPRLSKKAQDRMRRVNRKVAEGKWKTLGALADLAKVKED